MGGDAAPVGGLRRSWPTPVTLGIVFSIVGAIVFTAPGPRLIYTGNDSAAQSNLNTALTGADAYYTDGDESFLGLNDNSDPTTGMLTISHIDTGLSYISDRSSWGGHVVSLFVSRRGRAAGQYVEMTAFAPGLNICWGLLAVKERLDKAVNGKRAVGTYYFGVRGSSPRTCNAEKLARSSKPDATIRENGWPEN